MSFGDSSTSQLNKGKQGLALDTTVTRHLGKSPQQIFPRSRQNNELSFISIRDAKVAKAEREQRSNRAFRANIQSAGSTGLGLRDSSADRSIASLCQPIDSRIKGLRPSPLNLTSAVSPSARIIPIGLAVPSDSFFQRATPTSNGLEPPTPSIVITPAKEDVERSISPISTKIGTSRRPTSSVYSRCTAFGPDREHTPPIPPVPKSIRKYLPRDSDVTVFEEQEPIHGVDRAIPPTPRRSRGWWNIITSPFSASKAGSFFWRSPSIPEEELDSDGTPMLRNVSSIGISEHDGIIFTNRGLDDDEIRSAPAGESASCRDVLAPRRSNTAPKAFQYGGPNTSVGKHQVPQSGEAASYFDTSRNFGSPDPLDEDGLGYENDLARKISGSSGCTSDGGSGLRSPFDDTHEISDARRQPVVGPVLFSTPSQQELHGHSPDMTVIHSSTRQSTHGMIDSYFSPLTATPTVEEAHVGRFMAPASADLREIHVGPPRAASPQWEPETANSCKATSAATRPFPRHVRNESFGLGISEPSSPTARGMANQDYHTSSEKPSFIYQQSRNIEQFEHSKEGYTNNTSEPRQPWFRRWMWALFATIGVLIVTTIMLCVMLITPKHTDMAVEAQWLNLTGFPPLPTGVLTVKQLRLADAKDSCVQPKTLWSCGLPNASGGVKDHRDSTPSFRFVIRFQNGTVAQNDTQLGSVTAKSHTTKPRSIRKRDFWSDVMYKAIPVTPPEQEQIFLGQNSDNLSLPYQGKATPFFVSLMDPIGLGHAQGHDGLRRRDGVSAFPIPNVSSATGSNESSLQGHNASTSASMTIPNPSLEPNGQPIPPVLYPYASSQPLQLYNERQSSEHFGFYTYFDRSLYIANLSSGALDDAITTNIPLTEASAVCTWSQTRFMVRIWTRQPTVTNLDQVIPLTGLTATNSTANVMTGVGSFPYRVTMSLDRYGGEADKKGIYCYGLDSDKRVVKTAKMWVGEDRAVGGNLVHAAQVPGFGNHSQPLIARDDTAKASLGSGIDGGTGGCSCAWQNWQ